MTYHLTEGPKKNGRFIDPTKIKTMFNYDFDSLTLTKTRIQLLDGYILHIHPF